MWKEIQYKNMIQKCEKINIVKINQWTQAKEKNRYFNLDNLASPTQHQKHETWKWQRHRQVSLKQTWSMCWVFIQLGLHCQKVQKCHEIRERKTFCWIAKEHPSWWLCFRCEYMHIRYQSTSCPTAEKMREAKRNWWHAMHLVFHV